MEIAELITLIGNLFTNTLLGNVWLVGIFAIGFFLYICWKLKAGLEAFVVIFTPLILLLTYYGYLPQSLGYSILIALGFIWGLFILRLLGRSY